MLLLFQSLIFIMIFFLFDLVDLRSWITLTTIAGGEIDQFGSGKGDDEVKVR